MSDSLFKVVEVKPDGDTEDVLTTGPYHGENTWNSKLRVYPKLQTARVYRNRVRAMGRGAEIVRYEPVDVVE